MSYRLLDNSDHLFKTKPKTKIKKKKKSKNKPTQTNKQTKPQRPQEVIWSNPLLKAGSTVISDQVAQDFVQSDFENIQGWKLHLTHQTDG